MSCLENDIAREQLFETVVEELIEEGLSESSARAMAVNIADERWKRGDYPQGDYERDA